MNNDLISREALKKKFKDESYWTYTHEYGDAIPIGWIFSAIDNAPTVEYAFYQEAYQTGYEEAKKELERPQGEWVDEYWEDAYQESYHTCSICKKEMRTTHYDNFCPNCGAKMKRSDEE